MPLHAPPGDIRPIGLVVAGVEHAHTHTVQSDSVLRDADVTAFVLAAWYPRNPSDNATNKGGLRAIIER